MFFNDIYFFIIKKNLKTLYIIIFFFKKKKKKKKKVRDKINYYYNKLLQVPTEEIRKLCLKSLFVQ